MFLNCHCFVYGFFVPQKNARQLKFIPQRRPCTHHFGMTGNASFSFKQPSKGAGKHVLSLHRHISFHAGPAQKFLETQRRRRVIPTAGTQNPRLSGLIDPFAGGGAQGGSGARPPSEIADSGVSVRCSAKMVFRSCQCKARSTRRDGKEQLRQGEDARASRWKLHVDKSCDATQRW